MDRSAKQVLIPLLFVVALVLVGNWVRGCREAKKNAVAWESLRQQAYEALGQPHFLTVDVDYARSLLPGAHAATQRVFKVPPKWDTYHTHLLKELAKSARAAGKPDVAKQFEDRGAVDYLDPTSKDLDLGLDELERMSRDDGVRLSTPPTSRPVAATRKSPTTAPAPVGDPQP
jgi:hypothetical protein